MIKRFQNKIAESRYALPFTAVIAVLVCLLSGLIQEQRWLQMLFLTVSTYLLVVINNSHALIRIYSRSVSCFYLILTLAVGFLFPDLKLMGLQLCFIIFLTYFLNTYQNKQSMPTVFFAFLAIGVGSILFAPLLYLVPLFWLLMATNVLSMTIKTFWASVFGIITPYWFQGVYIFLKDNLASLLDMNIVKLFNTPFIATSIDYSHVSDHQILTFAVLALFSFTGSIHFMRHTYLDKIRTRMFMELFITLSTAIIACIILQPNFFEPLCALLIPVVAPLIGHFVSLTHTKVTNIATYLIIITMSLLTVYNIWLSDVTLF